MLLFRMLGCLLAVAVAMPYPVGVAQDEAHAPEKPGITEISDVPWTPVSPGPRPKVIYGEDDRIDVYEETDLERLEWAASTCALVNTTRLTQHGDGSYTISSPSAFRRWGLPPCEGERFGDQPTAAYCSGFMVGTDLIVTAGHCYSTGSLENTRFIFGFWMLDATTPRLHFDADEVYQGIEVVSFAGSGQNDHSVVRVDRPIRAPGARPFTLRREGVILPGEFVGVIGHPSGLPMKLAFGNTFVRRSDTAGYFVANLDTYGGNSGSPVINADTGILEGILVRGEQDFVHRGDCFESYRVPDDGGRGEDVTKATVFAHAVPAPDDPAAQIELDSEYYRCLDVIQVQVLDLSLAGESIVFVQVETAFGDAETFALVAVEGQPGYFTGSISLAPGAPVPDSGTVEVAHGDIVTVYYEDEEDGAPVFISASAAIDCEPPGIANVQETQVASTQARIEFTTDEPARVFVHYGPACSQLNYTASDSQYRMEHAVTLSGLTPDTRYFYVVEAFDRAGNAVQDDNNGACYSFCTVDVIEHFTEYFSLVNPIDVVPGQLRFLPIDHPNHYRACFVGGAALPVPAAGQAFLLADDDYVEVLFEGGRRFPFYGVDYDRVFIGSNGFVTFGEGDDSYQALPSRHFQLPRISALMSDLNPEAGGTVLGMQFSDRYVVTYYEVPLYDGAGVYPAHNRHTVQLELFFDGMIRIAWLEIYSGLVNAIVGLSRGLGTPSGFTSIDISALGDCDDIGYEGEFHSADTDASWRVTYPELLRVVALYEAGEYHCDAGAVDGYAAGPGPRDCLPHDSDYAPTDWAIGFGELLRAIQLHNANGYRPAPDEEDGFLPLP